MVSTRARLIGAERAGGKGWTAGRGRAGGGGASTNGAGPSAEELRAR